MAHRPGVGAWRFGASAASGRRFHQHGVTGQLRPVPGRAPGTGPGPGVGLGSTSAGPAASLLHRVVNRARAAAGGSWRAGRHGQYRAGPDTASAFRAVRPANTTHGRDRARWRRAWVRRASGSRPGPPLAIGRHSGGGRRSAGVGRWAGRAGRAAAGQQPGSGCWGPPGRASLGRAAAGPFGPSAHRHHHTGPGTGSLCWASGSGRANAAAGQRRRPASPQ